MHLEVVFFLFSVDFGRTWKNISSLVNNHSFLKDDGLQRNTHDPKWVGIMFL